MFITVWHRYKYKKLFLKTCVLSTILDDKVVSHCLTDVSILFDSRGTTLAKARFPNDLKRVGGTFRRPAEFVRLFERSSDTHCGASPWSGIRVCQKQLSARLSFQLTRFLSCVVFLD